MCYDWYPYDYCAHLEAVAWIVFTGAALLLIWFAITND